MTIRILADREPYSSFADEPSPEAPGARIEPIILNGPAGLDAAEPEILVLPVEQFFDLRPLPSSQALITILHIPYGPVAAMEKAFERGCADYLRDPWSLAELRARGLRLFSAKFGFGSRILELRGRLLLAQASSVMLNEDERAFLRLLILNAPSIVPRSAARSFFPSPQREETAALYHTARSLRRKMEDIEPGLGDRLLAVRNRGYRFDVRPVDKLCVF